MIRSWAEALKHPAISSIDDERPYTARVDGHWVDSPFVCHLNDGWEWDGFTSFGISGLKELRQELPHIHQVTPT